MVRYNMEVTLHPGGTLEESGTTMNATTKDTGGGGLGISVSKFVWIYVCPIILLVGVVGNCLTIAVMRRKRLRGGTVAIYLVLIAIADTCFLVVGIIPEWLEAMGIVTFKHIHPATCKIEKFLGYTAGDTAIWLLVVFTLDRFVAVCFPLRKSEVCTTKRAKILGGSAFLLAILKNFHVFFTRGAEYKVGDDGESELKSNCGRPTPTAEYFENFIRPWIVFTLVSAIPLILICAFNIGIVRTLLCMPKSTPATSPVRGGTSSSKTERKYSQTTLMCISVSILFLVTITPSIVLVIGRPYWDTKERKGEPNYMYLTAKGINNALVFMNHSLNFFLYCLTGRRFREQLFTMFASMCSCCRNSHFSNSAAQKASLYLKSIHKFSQEFISTGQRTDETTAGTSVSTGFTGTTCLSRQSTKSTSNMKHEKSKESVKSLDSDSSYNNVPIDFGEDALLKTNISDIRSRNGSNSPLGKAPVRSAATIVTAGGVNKTETRCSVYVDENEAKNGGASVAMSPDLNYQHYTGGDAENSRTSGVLVSGIRSRSETRADDILDPVDRERAISIQCPDDPPGGDGCKQTDGTDDTTTKERKNETKKDRQENVTQSAHQGATESIGDTAGVESIDK